MLKPRVTFAAAFLVMCLILLALFGREPDEMIAGAAQAIDGDSLIVNGREMRLRGLDAPEARQTCELAGKEVACGRQATFALQRWLARGPVTCIGNEVDRYRRLLVTCRVNGQDIGADLVKNGFAVDYGSYPEEERAAMADNRGVWAGKFERPSEYRRRMRESGQAAHRPPLNR